MQFNRSKFKEKLFETLKAVFPILAIVLLLCFSIAPIPPSILMTFLIGAVLLVAGMLLFNVGVELSMTPMGERVGTIMTRSKKLPVIHAKGTGMELAEKFMGVSLATEKEKIFIVTRKEQKNEIMKAIMEKAGLNSRAKSIVFSLPVTDTAGLRLIED